MGFKYRHSMRATFLKYDRIVLVNVHVHTPQRCEIRHKSGKIRQNTRPNRRISALHPHTYIVTHYSMHSIRGCACFGAFHISDTTQHTHAHNMTIMGEKSAQKKKTPSCLGPACCIPHCGCLSWRWCNNVYMRYVSSIHLDNNACAHTPAWRPSFPKKSTKKKRKGII